MSFIQYELKRLMKVSDHDLNRILSYYVPYSADKEDHEFDYRECWDLNEKIIDEKNNANYAKNDTV